MAVLGVSVLLFTGLDALRADPAPVVAGAAPTAVEEPAVTQAPVEGSSTPAAPTPVAPSPAAPSSEPEPAPSPDPSPTPAAPTIDPGDVSVQVLDADGVLDGTPFDRVVATIADVGYRVVATNPASRTYEATTVFYTAGNETAARELAVVLGYDEVAEKPDNLSDSVSLHIVVGADQTG
jgi:hypothetical protein